MTCRHCQRRKATHRRRGLCWTCRLDPSIRELYPQTESKYTPRGEPTEEELERCIAEQIGTMPKERGR